MAQRRLRRLNLQDGTLLVITPINGLTDGFHWVTTPFITGDGAPFSREFRRGLVVWTEGGRGQPDFLFSAFPRSSQVDL